MSTAWVGYALLVIAAIIIYVPVTFIMLRNVPFRPFLKYCFSVTIVPLFVSLLLYGIFTVKNWAPQLADLYVKARQFEDWFRGWGSLEGLAAAVVFLPIPVAGAALWYWLFWYLNRKLPTYS